MNLALTSLSLVLWAQDPVPKAGLTARAVYEELAEKAGRLKNTDPRHPSHKGIIRTLAAGLETHAALFATGEGVFWRGRVLLLTGDREGAGKAFEAYADDPKAEPRLANEARARAALVAVGQDRLRARVLFGRCDHKTLQPALLAEVVSALEGAVETDLLPELPIEKVLNGPADLTIDQLKNNVLVLEFFATWCGPCRATISRLVELQAQKKHLGVQVIGITTLYGMGVDFADKDAVPNGGRSVRGLDAEAEHDLVANFAKAFEINYPIVFTGERVAAASFGVRGIPSTLVVGRDGKIVGSVVGSNARRVEELVEQALGAASRPKQK